MNIIGTMRALDETRGAVRVEDIYDTDIHDLWQACTNPQRLERWIATLEISVAARNGRFARRSNESTHWTRRKAEL